MSDKRTQAQLEFDMAKHGWAFCNRAMLEGKVVRLEELAKRLKTNDKRHAVLEAITLRLQEMEG